VAHLNGRPADAVYSSKGQIVDELKGLAVAVEVHIEGKDAGAGQDKADYVPGDPLA